MITRMFGNWKTSLLGVAAGVLNLIANGTDWKSALFSGVLTLLGLAAKDATTGSAPGMIRGIIAFALLAGMSGESFAAPTPVNRTLAWDHDGAGIAGYRIYYAKQNAPGYSDTQRVEIPDPAVRSITVSDYVTAKGALCFVVTAYDPTGSESGYSNEACGFFGVTAPSNARVQ